MVQEVAIVGALRTPIGCFNGALAPLQAHEVLILVDHLIYDTI